MRRACLVVALACVAPVATAQPRGGVLTVRLTNGTTGAPGAAQKVTLFRLRQEMIPAKELGAVEGTFEITDIEVEGQRPMLLQVTSAGVNYNQPIRFGRGYEAEADVTVYDTLDRWDTSVIELAENRSLYRRDGDRVRVDKVFVVRNTTSPPRTYYNPGGTFRFNMPTETLIEMRSVQASGSSGMPVPQQASVLPDGLGYVTKTAFKPGDTEIVVSYDVRYDDGRLEVQEQAFYPVREIGVFVAPADIDVEAPGWTQGVEPEGRYTALAIRDVKAGTPVNFTLTGGSARANLPIGGESSSTGGGGGGNAASSQGTITLLPDATSSSKWVLVVLMAAALGYGLLSALYPSTRRG